MTKKITKTSTSKKTKKQSTTQQEATEPTSKYLKPTTDIAFKKLFGTQERANLTKDFLNSILEKKAGELITKLTILCTVIN